jgi:transposase
LDAITWKYLFDRSVGVIQAKSMLLVDRGYDADWIRALVNQQGAWANIPPKRNRKDPICFSPYLYRARNLVERFFNKTKQCRRVATRYDKLAANYLAFIKLASIRIWLRANESTPSLWRRRRRRRTAPWEPKIQFSGVGGLLTYISFRQGVDDMNDHDEWMSYSHWGMFATGTK